MILKGTKCIPKKTYYRYLPVILESVKKLFNDEQKKLLSIIKELGKISMNK